MSIDVKSWAKKYKELTEKDETIKAMAKYYTCSFLFDMGSVKVIIEMHLDYHLHTTHVEKK